jgi:Asp-tRNA(Asn)/Glu-tRNA(Gln) amidotransferase A subunit family amidase
MGEVGRSRLPSRESPRRDPVEQAVRATYAGWAEHGLDVVRTLADGPTTPVAWPSAEPPPGSPTRWKPRDTTPSDTTTGDALTTGWLVASADDTTAGSGPVAGLTVAVKDIIDVAGLPTRHATPGGLWRDPTDDAAAWARLRAAGARCVGKAATHEMAWGITTAQVPHPLDPGRIVGGSSGGSAACVAAGVAQGALGTDTGGSVRVPAALCGVVGIRPTTGTVDMRGITPLAPEQDVVGPLATDVDTCTAMLEVLLDRPLGPTTGGVAGLRVGVLARPGRLAADVEQAYVGALEALRDEGADVVTCDSVLFRQAGSVSLLTMLISSARQHAAAVHADPAGFGGEARALLTLGEDLLQHEGLIARARAALTAATAALFAEQRLDAFVTPTTPCTAPLRGADTVDIGGRPEAVSAALTRFNAWASVTGVPAASVPLPSPGLPCGLQVMAPPRREDVCVRVARTLEQPTRRTQP